MYFGFFIRAGNRGDCVVNVAANDDQQALQEFRRLWSRAKVTSSVVDGYLYEKRGRLLQRATTTHSLDD